MWRRQATRKKNSMEVPIWSSMRGNGIGVVFGSSNLLRELITVQTYNVVWCLLRVLRNTIPWNRFPYSSKALTLMR
jgi:hypothetical protein